MRKPTSCPEILDLIEGKLHAEMEETGLELARDSFGAAEIHDSLTESYLRLKDTNGKEYWLIVKQA